MSLRNKLFLINCIIIDLCWMPLSGCCHQLIYIIILTYF